MSSIIRLSDINSEELQKIFGIADKAKEGDYTGKCKAKTFVLFFPNSSIRTRITFEKVINNLGGQIILFPSDSLDKREDLKDVIGYMNNWADFIIIRHKNINVLTDISRYSCVPVLNAMTDINHPCEVLSDLYTISGIRKDYLSLQYTFIGINGNIGLAWKEAFEAFGIKLRHVCPEGYEMSDVPVYHDLERGILGSDIIITDSLPQKENIIKDFKPFQITVRTMKLANQNAMLNPCPPFYRGEEVSSDVINSNYFVGYKFKNNLLYIQEALVNYLLTD